MILLKQDSPSVENPKRRTACSTTCPSLGRGVGYTILSWPGGTPGQGAPTWDWCTSYLGLGYPHLGLGSPQGLGYPLPGTGYPTWDWGTPHLGLGYHPPEGTWDQSLGTPLKGHVTSGWKHYGGRWGTPNPKKAMGPVVGSVMAWRWDNPSWC